ncbi:MAG: hypothetical protein Tsb0014_15380 [Pleurocapsa sp.]
MEKIIKLDRQAIVNYLKLSSQLNDTVESIVACQIIESTAAKLGIQASDRELQQAADDFRLTNQLHNIEDTWMWLKENYLSMDDFENLIRTNIITSKLVEHLFKDRVEAIFYQNQLDYAGVAMYEVVLDDEDLAFELFLALQEGEISFHEVARQYETNPNHRRSGGYCGILKRKDLKPEISAAVFAASPPQLLKPIFTSQGIHLILVEEIIKPDLDEQLRAQIMSALFSDWLRQQREEIKIITEFETSNDSSQHHNQSPATMV